MAEFGNLAATAQSVLQMSPFLYPIIQSVQEKLTPIQHYVLLIISANSISGLTMKVFRTSVHV